ncbi:thioredoxin [Desulfosalsimonas propionicica]|uniref:Thioredoxin n=1 Tax=Desulfosalsimonas propionicica TaxID=332175 RepID=A0A7W0C5S3_9BACT|nr:thioredoxin domain-containing protein [Desulfosalsimonas propionicica]MBA2879699.1 thioredoxin [Desulfosalsimonas propionicica]
MKIQDAFNNRPVEVTENTFESQIVNSPVPVLAVFWAPWCTACRAVLPAVDRIASNLTGRIKVAKIHMEQNPALASRFQVMNVPFMIIFDNGAEKDSMAGAVPETDILKKLTPYY